MGSSNQAPPQTSTSTTTTELPDFVQDPARDYLQRAVDLSQQPFRSYEGERVAPFTPLHNAVFDAAPNFAPTLTGGINTMADFAMPSSAPPPIYVHPFLGGPTPVAQPAPVTAPLPAQAAANPGAGGKGGAIAAPTPVTLAPIPDDLSLITPTINPIAPGGLTQGMQANPAGYAALPAGSDADEQQVGDMPYYGNLQDMLANMAFGPMGALGKVAYNVATNQPNSIYTTISPSGQMGFSDNTSLVDNMTIDPDDFMGDTFDGGFDSDIGMGY